jgi:uncharacterized membrane protein YjjP (DUF1212 family)
MQDESKQGAGTRDDASERALDLIVELSRALHVVTLPSDMIEELMGRVSRQLGASSQLLVLQSAVIAQVGIDDRSRVAVMRIPFDTQWRLERMQEVTAIARDVADGRLGVSAARAQLAHALARPSQHGQLAVLAAYAVYSAAVAARIGGRWLEMVGAAIVGLVAGAIHMGTAHREALNLQKSFLAGLFGTLCVLALALVLPGLGQAQVLFGGMTLLVPAMVITIGMHELASGALESGISRAGYGFLRFAMIAAGIAAGAAIWRLVAPIAAAGTPHALPEGVVLAILVVGALALVVCLQLRWHDAPWVIGGVLVAFAVQELTKHFIPDRGAPMVSAFMLASVAYLQARATGRSPAFVLVPGMLQLAPGFLGTKAVLHLLTGTGGGDATFFDVALVALQLSIGILMAGVLLRPGAAQAQDQREPRRSAARKQVRV